MRPRSSSNPGAPDSSRNTFWNTKEETIRSEEATDLLEILQGTVEVLEHMIESDRTVRAGLETELR